MAKAHMCLLFGEKIVQHIDNNGNYYSSLHLHNYLECEILCQISKQFDASFALFSSLLHRISFVFVQLWFLHLIRLFRKVEKYVSSRNFHFTRPCLTIMEIDVRRACGVAM